MLTTRRISRALQPRTGFAANRCRAARNTTGATYALLSLFAALSLLFAPPLAASPGDNSDISRLQLAAVNAASPEPGQTIQLASESLTREQGDAILQELRAIRQLLEKQQATNNRPRKPTSASIDIGDSPTLGRDDAPVTMVEFTDFQCPYCKRFHDNTFPKLRQKFIDTGKLRYVSMDLPLKFHQQARPAAQAARCAGEQDRFWQMRETLFENARALGKEALLGYAGDLSLDTEAFAACLEDQRHQREINRDIGIARKAGFTGTPSFVIGRIVDGQVRGTVLIGARPLAEFESQIQRLLPGAETDG